MIVVTIVAQKNGETIYFDEPIPKVHFIKLISCSLFNSWYTLKNEGSAALGDPNKDESLSIAKLPQGHYTLESMAKEINGLFGQYKYHQLETETNKPVAQLVIKNFGAKPITLDRDLASLLGIGRKLNLITYVKRLTSPTTYFVHCDLIDKQQNLFNGKK